MEGPDKPDNVPDDWWWLAITKPDSTVHLYELGYPTESQSPRGIKVHTVLEDERHNAILAELGATWDDFGDPFDGWRQEMAPGRPNRWLEPKAYNEHGELLPILAKPGVTLHLKDA